jgi:hypothetical protein
MPVDMRPATPALWYLVAESLRITHGRVDWLQTRVVRYGFVAGGNNSVVECDLAKVEVAGSNPVSRSNLRSRLRLARELRLASQLASYEAALRSVRTLL